MARRLRTVLRLSPIRWRGQGAGLRPFKFIFAAAFLKPGISREIGRFQRTSKSDPSSSPAVFMMTAINSSLNIYMRRRGAKPDNEI